MGEMSLLEIFKESFTLVILMGCSLLSITFTIERWLYLRKAQGSGDPILSHVHKLIENGKMTEAQNYCNRHPSAAAQVIAYGLLHSGRPRHDLEELLASKRMEERLKLDRYLAVLGTMGNIAPFIGLFGTVIGIIKAFRDLALAGGGGPSVVAKGIAEALVATAAGLLVAIPAAILYNYFMRKVKFISTDMEVASTRLLVMLGVK